MTKPNDDTVYLRRDIMEALKRSDEKMDSYSGKTDEKWKATEERLTKNRKIFQKDRRKNG